MGVRVPNLAVGAENAIGVELANDLEVVRQHTQAPVLHGRRGSDRGESHVSRELTAVGCATSYY